MPSWSPASSLERMRQRHSDLGVNHRYFKLRGTNGATYSIRHDVAAGRWELLMFEACAPRR